MKSIVSICVLGMLSILTPVTSMAAIFDDAAKAHRQIEKGKMHKAKETAREAIQKDTLDPAAYFALSRTFIEIPKPYAFDSAYRSLSKGKKLISKLSLEDSIKVLERCEGFYLDSFSIHFYEITYTRAKRINSVSSYSEFIEKYPEAIQTPRAITIRDSLAFEIALTKESSDAMREFARIFKNAAQITEAKSIEELYAFEEETRYGQLESYNDFLKSRPKSDFREEAEEMIFRLMLLDFNQDSITSFITQFPESPFSDLGKRFLNQIDLEEDGPRARSSNSYVFPYQSSISGDVKVLSPKTSLPTNLGEIELLTGVIFQPAFCPWVGFENSKGLGWANLYSGQVQDAYSEINWNDSALFIAKKDGLESIYLPDGNQLFQSPFDRLQALGKGFFQGTLGDTKKLVSAFGYIYDAPKFDSARVIENTLLLKTKDWEAFSIGKVHSSGQSSNPIWRSNSIKIVGKDLIVKQDSVFQLFHPKSGELNFQIAGKAIKEIETGWKVDKGGSYWSYFDKQGREISADSISSSFLNPSGDSDFDFYKYPQGWKTQNDSTIFDSLSIVAGSFLRGFKNATSYLIQDSCCLKEPTPDEGKIILTRSNPKKAFLVINTQKATLIKNFCGDTLMILPEAKEVVALSDTIFRIETKDGFGLSSPTKTNLIPSEYNGLELDYPYVTTYNKDGFGLYDLSRDITIPNFSQSPIGHLLGNEKVHFFGTKSDSLALVDTTQRLMLEPRGYLEALDDTLLFYKGDLGNTGIYNTNTKAWTELPVGQIERVVSGNLKMYTQGFYGIYNLKKGDFIIPPLYEEIKLIEFDIGNIHYLGFKQSKPLGYEMGLYDRDGELLAKDNIQEEVFDEYIFNSDPFK